MSATPVFGAPEGWDAFLLARRRGEFAGPVVHVTRDDARMARLAEALAFVVPEAEVLRFPAWDCLPYDRVSPNPALVSERIATLARLLEKPTGPRIVLTTVNALVQRVPPRAAFAGASLELRANGTVQPEKLARFLEASGYGRAGTVMEPGEYAMRGGIIDVFPAGESDPVRLDLFGDTIESIRIFDPGTAAQRRSPPAPDAASGVRGAARPRRDLAFPLGLARHLRPAGGRGSDLSVDLGGSAASGHGALGSAVPRADGDAARLSAGRLGQPGPPGGRGAGGAAGDDRGPLRRAAPGAARRRGAVPAAAARAAVSRSGGLGRDAGRRSAVRVLAVRQAGWRGRRRWRWPPGAGVLPGRAAAPASMCSNSCAARPSGGAARAAGSSSLPGPVAHASGSPICCGSTASRTRRRRTAGRRSAASRRVGVAGHAGRGARLRRRRSGTGGRAGPAGRAHQPTRRAGASAPTSSSRRRRRSPRATWWCTRNTASAATTGWRR